MELVLNPSPTLLSCTQYYNVNNAFSYIWYTLIVFMTFLYFFWRHRLACREWQPWRHRTVTVLTQGVGNTVALLLHLTGAWGVARLALNTSGSSAPAETLYTVLMSSQVIPGSSALHKPHPNCYCYKEKI